MIRFNCSKEKNRQGCLQAEARSSHEAEQILHLKRLLVTLKQHYEKSVHQIQVQLQVEQDQNVIAQKELEKARGQLLEIQQTHEEELQALRSQQNILKELLKKVQDEVKQKSLQPDMSTELSNPELTHQKVEQLECALAHQLERTEESDVKIQQLLKELSEAQKKNQELEKELSKNHQDSQKEITYLQKLLEEQQQQEYAYKQLHELENCKKNSEASLAQDNECVGGCKQLQEMETKIELLNESVKEKENLQDKYEQFKEELRLLNGQLKEALEMRIQADLKSDHLETVASNQEFQLQEFAQQLQILEREKGDLESEKERTEMLLGESEMRLKVAQQHLAKKVKEVALLNEKLEQQEGHLTDFTQIIEYQKNQLVQLQASLDLYQKQEQRLQDQLHEALKGTESQILKWEEKYFHMCDKWQESENRVRELKALEEKHLQIQALLSNLGNFMGKSFNPSDALIHAEQKSIQSPNTSSFSFEAPFLAGSSSPNLSQSEDLEEKYDLFGMQQASEKSPSPFLNE